MIKNLNEIYKCAICGNIVEAVHTGKGTLACCGQEMILQVTNTIDASREKHVPVVESTATGVKVKIGSVPHPMEAEHYIEWIEIIADGRTERQYLSPGDAPETEFAGVFSQVIARAYCNLHGLWQS